MSGATPGIAQTILIALLGGGAVNALVAFVKDRREARKFTEDRVRESELRPLEAASVVTKGAESAVLSLSKALENTQAQVSQLERERDYLSEQLAATRRHCDQMAEELDRVRAQLTEVRLMLLKVQQD